MNTNDEFCCMCIERVNSAINLYDNDYDDIQYFSKFKQLFPDVVLEEDYYNLPKYICANCCTKLKDAYNFKKQCISSIEYLKKCIRNCQEDMLEKGNLREGQKEEHLEKFEESQNAKYSNENKSQIAQVINQKDIINVENAKVSAHNNSSEDDEEEKKEGGGVGNYIVIPFTRNIIKEEVGIKEQLSSAEVLTVNSKGSSIHRNSSEEEDEEGGDNDIVIPFTGNVTKEEVDIKEELSSAEVVAGNSEGSSIRSNSSEEGVGNTTKEEVDIKLVLSSTEVLTANNEDSLVCSNSSEEEEKEERGGVGRGVVVERRARIGVKRGGKNEILIQFSRNFTKQEELSSTEVLAVNSEDSSICSVDEKGGENDIVIPFSGNVIKEEMNIKEELSSTDILAANSVCNSVHGNSSEDGGVGENDIVIQFTGNVIKEEMNIKEEFSLTEILPANREYNSVHSNRCEDEEDEEGGMGVGRREVRRGGGGENDIVLQFTGNVIKEEVDIKDEPNSTEILAANNEGSCRDSRTCKECQKEFPYENQLRRHMLVHTGVKPYSCTECQQPFKDKSHLKQHVLSTHLGVRPYSCTECHKKFSRKNHLNLHMTLHTGAMPYTCNVCHKKFNYESQLERHMNIHTGAKPFTCTDCRKQFTDKSHLKQHMSIHTGFKPYRCKECPKQFSRKNYLERHTTVHTGEKAYSCEICQKTFKYRGTLKKHASVHSDAKPFSCKECPKQFRQKYNLTAHMSAHTDAKPYCCNECHKHFTRKNYLDKHLIVHKSTRIFSCKECHKQFRQEKTLKKHMSTHVVVKSCNIDSLTKETPFEVRQKV